MRRGVGAATRRQRHWTAAEVVASADVIVPTVVGDVACLLWLFNQGRRILPQHFLCVISVLLSIHVRRFFLGPSRMNARSFSDAKARKLFSPNKNN